MFLYSYIYIHLKTKSFFWFGIIIGILISLNLSTDDDNSSSCMDYINIDSIDENKIEFPIETKVNLAKKPLIPKKLVKPIVRPRYYSTELGIREKLFVGVLTSFENLDSVGISINVSIGQYVNKATDKSAGSYIYDILAYFDDELVRNDTKTLNIRITKHARAPFIKYFVQALHNQARDISLNNVVGFTDPRETHRPFHIFKYIADNFIQDYDFFFLMPDKAYINGNKLKNMLSKISVTQDIYTGVKVEDSSYCSLDAGILFSNSVVRKIKNNLEWCIKNAVSNEHTDNIGRCTVFAIDKECQESVQGQQFKSYKAKFFSFKKHLKDLVEKPELIDSVSVYPVVNAEDIYILHSFFSKQTLIDVQQQIDDLRQSILDTSNLHPPEFSEISWPIGDKKRAKPLNRYDLIRYDLINLTHIFMRDDFQSVVELNPSEKQDVEGILDAVISRVNFKYNNQLKYRRLVNMYRLFDPNQGINYIIDLGLKNLSNGKEVIKRMEVVKTLGQTEILPVPYVTENSRVTIILPILASERLSAENFINMYMENIMPRREKTYLMLVFLYENDAPSKGNDDIFADVKKTAQKISEKSKTTLSGIAWVSIKFPSNEINRYDKRTIFTILDLSLRKIGLDALVLYLDIFADIRFDFLNRVRMNTISEYQAFFPIPFTQFNPKISERDDLDVNKNVGQFDTSEYNYFSFYGRDYVKTRRKTEKIVPIVRADKDIPNIMMGNFTEFRNIFEYMLKNNDNLHFFRAIEPSLKIKYRDACHDNSETIRLGSKIQLAKLILDNNFTLP